MKPIKITATKVDLENNSIVIYFDEESAVDSLTNDQKFAALSAHIQAIRKYEEDADTPTRYGKSQVGNYEPADKPNWLERLLAEPATLFNVTIFVGAILLIASSICLIALKIYSNL